MTYSLGLGLGIERTHACSNEPQPMLRQFEGCDHPLVLPAICGPEVKYELYDLLRSDCHMPVTT